MNCNETLPLMHEYLDGDLPQQEVARLKRHMLECASCRAVFSELETAEVFTKSMPRVKAPDSLANRIMLSLPPVKKKNSWLTRLRRHPALSVAAVFLFVMMGSYLSLWNQDKELLVKGDHLDQVVIKGDTVYVPRGRTVEGNLTVKGGSIDVEGNIQGNLVVIGGSANLASTAKVGSYVKIDQATSWLWYKVNEFWTLLSK